MVDARDPLHHYLLGDDFVELHLDAWSGSTADQDHHGTQISDLS